MLTAREIVEKYIAFFEKRGHKRIANAPLVPVNDPTTLFTSSGMQPLVPYLLGEKHPQGTRLVNVQNSFRAQDVEEVGNSRHTTFFRMLGNWSLRGDYFKKEQLPWIFEFLTDKEEGLGLDPHKLYVTAFSGDKRNKILKDTESGELWKEIFKKHGIEAKKVVLENEEKAGKVGMQDGRIFYYDAQKNWWSRAGVPEKMPAGEPGGPDSEIFYEFDEVEHNPKFGKFCHPNCDCGRFFEISNSVFMEYLKQPDGSFTNLPAKNVDHGGGLERYLCAHENQSDVFKTSLLYPIIKALEQVASTSYEKHAKDMRIVVNHFASAIYIIAADVSPSNTEQGYMLRRLLRRGLDSFYALKGTDLAPIIESIVNAYKDTDPLLLEKYEHIKASILEEEESYKKARVSAQKAIDKELAKKGIRRGDDLTSVLEIPADLAFKSTASYGLGPTQLKSLGYTFDDQAFAEEMKKHQQLSRVGAEKKFRGGLADTLEKTIMGHTATHLLHQALRDVLGNQVHQSGSNITTERVRFDFNFDKKLTDEEIAKVEGIVNEKIKKNLPVHFELIPTNEAFNMGAIGLFMDTYGNKSKIYFIGGSNPHPNPLPKGEGDHGRAYSIEFCGGPHVEFTGVLKSFKIIKQENLGKNQKRLYAVVG
ncbi:MAG: alanine--tRNA ligase [Candidatus Levybacteria bacterium]|nr:alanine--tRNA ligase [Candidatus Levybacteria bacterium]